MNYLPSIAYVLLGFVILVISKIIRDAWTPYNDDEHLTGKDNPALGISVAGYYLSVFIIFICASLGDLKSEIDSLSFLTEIGIDAAYAISGIIALNIGRLILDRIALPRFSVTKELISDRNVGMGWVQSASYVGTAIIIGSALIGEGAWFHALATWVIAQMFLIGFIKFYQVITPYDIHEQLEKDNAAVGISLASNIVAISIILFGANARSFESWYDFYVEFCVLAVIGLVMLVISRLIVDRMMLPKSKLNDEISRDRNSAAAWIEGAIAIGFASTIVCMI